MPLLDHFETPLDPRRAWESFHSRWANSLADQLNEKLPQRYFAQVQIRLGTQVEADVAEFESHSSMAETSNGASGGSVAVETWAPPAAALVMPAVFPDDLEVHVRNELDDARLVAVVELVSPRNKDRPANRIAFAAKTAAYLQRGIGLVVIDVITGRWFNLHNELTRLLGLDAAFAMADDALLYAVAYRPVRRGEEDQIDTWPEVLKLGTALPVVPLWLRGSSVVPLSLNAAYEDACHRSRI